MRHLGYQLCLADPDLWFKAEVQPDDGFKYYAYVLLYVDNCMAIGHDPLTVLNQLDKFFTMKKGSIGDPDIYLGCKVKKMTLPNGVVAWGMSPSKYIQEAVQNCEDHLHKRYDGRKLAKKATNPYVAGYEPELDVSELLGPEDATYYQVTDRRVALDD
jgi:hypothetical protein